MRSFSSQNKVAALILCAVNSKHPLTTVIWKLKATLTMRICKNFASIKSDSAHNHRFKPSFQSVTDLIVIQ